MDHLPLRHLLLASILTVGSLSGLQPTLEHKILNLHLTGSLTPRNRYGKSQLSMSTHTSIHTPALFTMSMAQEPSRLRETEQSHPSLLLITCMVATQRLPVHIHQSRKRLLLPQLNGLLPTQEHRILISHPTGSLTPKSRSGKNQLSMSTHISIHTPVLSITSMAPEPSLTKVTEPSPLNL